MWGRVFDPHCPGQRPGLTRFVETPWYRALGTCRRYRRHIRNRAHCLRSQFQNRVANHVIRLELLRKRYHHTAAPNNAHLLARNLADCITQIFLVIE